MSKKTRNVWVLTAALFLVVAALFIPPAQAAGKGNKWIALRHRFKPGETLEYAVTMNMSGQEGDMPINIDVETGLKMKVLAVDTKGTATVTLTLDEMNMDMQVMGQSMNMRMGPSGLKVTSGGQIVYDSSAAGGTGQMQMDQMGMFGGMMDEKLFRQGLTATITKLGETTIPDLASGSGDDAMGFDVFEQRALPEKLVRPGDTWTTQVPIPGFGGPGSGAGGSTAEAVLESIETVNGRLLAKISAQMDTDISQLIAGQPGVPATGVPEMRMTGQMTTYFNIEEGYVLRESGEFSMNMAGSPGAPGLGGGESMNIVLKRELRE